MFSSDFYSSPPPFLLLQDYSSFLELLDEGWKSLVLGDLKETTKEKYANLQDTYLGFCFSVGVASVPTSETSLLRYIAYLVYSKGLAASTVKTHLAAVRHLHLINGHEVDVLSLPRVRMAKACATKTGSVKPLREPIPLSALAELGVVTVGSSSYDDVMFFTGCLLAFFGFLRVSELSAPQKANSKTGISVGDVCVSSSSISFLLRSSKTDSLSQGVRIYISEQDVPPCPVKWLSVFLKVRPITTSSAPLLVFRNGVGMKAKWFRDKLKETMRSLGLAANFNTHSLRIGAATHAANLGFSDHEIMRLGRWKSSAFLKYIRSSESNLLALSKRLGKF